VNDPRPHGRVGIDGVVKLRQEHPRGQAGIARYFAYSTWMTSRRHVRLRRRSKIALARFRTRPI
jgi:hypothetical protein